MIYAKEARKISKENANPMGLHQVIDKTLPIIEEAIRTAAKYGVTHACVKKDVLMEAADTYFFTRKQIMDAIAAEIREFGYDATIPTSYTSIHIDW